MPHLVLLRGAPGAGKTEIGSLFAQRFGWMFIELDQIKRSRGDIRVADPGAFLVAGEQARSALEAGRDVIAEEYFRTPDLIGLFLGPTGLSTSSGEFVAVWLACDGAVASKRKGAQGLMSEDLALKYNSLAADRLLIKGEIVIDTTSTTFEQAVEELATALRARGLAVLPPE